MMTLNPDDDIRWLFHAAMQEPSYTNGAGVEFQVEMRERNGNLKEREREIKGEMEPLEAQLADLESERRYLSGMFDMYIFACKFNRNPPCYQQPGD